MPLFDYTTGPASAEDLEAFVAGAQAVVNAHFAENFPGRPADVLTALPITDGGRIMKIVSKGIDERHASAWAFIDVSTGLIYKPSNHRVPAKYPRGTIHTAAFGAEHVGPFGPRHVKDLVA